MADRVPMAGKIGFRPPDAIPGDAMQGDPVTRYSRLTNPDLLVTAGQWTNVQSTFLYAIRFVPYAQAEDDEPTPQNDITGDLFIEFINGAVCNFRGRTYLDYKTYLEAPSKGKHHKNTPWYSDYTLIRPARFKGAALAARVRANG
jgi:hypothetical protein